MKAKDKNNLLKKYSEIKYQLIKTLENSDCEIDVDGDLVDQLQGQTLVNVQNQISKNNLAKLRAVDSALEMIAKGEYGDCSECGDPIAIKRLEAIPGITTCVICAELSERNR
jgi:RNA polymerase-binding transcription factor DksA